MPTNPLIAGRDRANERSPTDPQECCDWANARLAISEPSGDRCWVVTGDPAKPIALVRR